MPVGRAHELAAVDRALGAALDGCGSVVLLGGEPGIGKTTLAEESRRRGAARGMATGWGGSPATGAPPFLPWRVALRHTCPGAAAALAAAGGGEQDARFRLFETVADALGAAPPTLLVLDDLQWADPASVQLLRFLLRTLRTSRVVLVGTYRAAEVPATGGLADVLAELGGAGIAMRLGGLGPAEVEALAGALGAPAADVDRLHERTGGSPFLVEQLCALGDLRSSAPPAVAALLQRRLRDLPPACREVLEVAAVAGRVVDLRLVAQVLDRPAADLLDCVDRAVDGDVLRLEGAATVFVHDLMREAVEADLPGLRRAELHLRCGNALAAQQDRLDEAARHLQAGAALAGPSCAVDVTLAAARQARAALAFEQEAGHLAWVAEALGAAVGSDVLLALGHARLGAGDWDGAAASFSQAADAARATGDPDALARAALGLGAGTAGFEIRLMDAAQIALLEEAAVALGDRPGPLRAYVLARLSVALAFVDAPGRRDALSRQAVALAEQAGDPAALAYALATRADVLAGPDHVQERLTLSARVVELGRQAGDDQTTLLGHRLRVVALLEIGDVAALDREIRDFTVLAERHRVPVVRWYVHLFAGMRALMRGELEAALRCADEAAAIGALAGSQNAVMLVGTLRLAVAAEQGTLAVYADEVLAMVEPHLARNPALAGGWVVLGTVCLATGDVARARVALHALARLDFGERDSEWLGTLTGAADLCARLGEVTYAGRLYELMAPYEGLLVVDGIAAACLAAVDDVLARLATLLGRQQDAERHRAAALQTYERVGMPRAAAALRARVGATPQPGGEAVFRREGELWLLRYAGREVRLAHAKGLRDLHLLVSCAGRELPVAALVGGIADGPVDVVLDETARRAYRQRLADLQDEIDEGERYADPERVTRCRAERQALLEALAAATGLHGRARGTISDQERARQAVRARIRHVLQRLEPVHPELARHLTSAVRTGARCGYLPEREIAWQT